MDGLTGLGSAQAAYLQDKFWQLREAFLGADPPSLVTWSGRVQFM